ncbi:hypothetical protein GCM10008905_16920 [Clostridium malenominatum]|uniref:Uncharacterized protein n=1 Tax=Clostridium malenominatum TaxID=1539 RepID=A0ABN1IY87_9CLOT
MFWHKKRDGFIIPYSFFMGILCITMSFYLLSMECNVYINNYLLLKYILK